MFERRSLTWPITLGVTLIVLVVFLIVGWVLLTLFPSTKSLTPLYWTLFAVGSLFLLLVLVGVVLYLTLTVKEINLNRRQSNFMDSVTHELKSPIASLKLYLQTLHRHRVSPEEQEGFFRFMLDDVERLDRLINHLLAAAKLERRAVDEDVGEVPLDQLLRQCVDEVRLRYRTPVDAVQLTLMPCTVRARRLDLELIFRNLIDNAVKYAGEPPHVEIHAYLKSPKMVEVTIGDNGPGIPQNLRRRIFGRFARLGMELERKKPGVGLGLYLEKSLVQRLKGHVSIRDSQSGVGTVFEVQLPGAAVPPPHELDATAQAPRPSEIPPSNAREMTLLPAEPT